MKKKKIIPIILLSTFIGTNIIGCQKTATSQAETKYYSLNIYGDKQYYNENYEEIEGVNDIINKFMDYSINLNYTNEEYLKQLDLYTDEIRIIDEQTGFKEYLQELNVSRELIRNLDGYEISEIEFYQVSGADQATVTLDYISTVTNATQEYLDGLMIELNAKYTTNTSIKIQKQSDGWRIVEILSIGDRIKVE